MIKQFNENSYNTLKNALDISSMKNKVIANNIANINTENYTKYNINFQEALKNETKIKNLKTTRNKHISSNSIDNKYIYKDTSGDYKTDGNNVDLDTEKIEQATNSLMYNTLISRISGKLNTIGYVIAGGN